MSGVAIIAVRCSFGGAEIKT